MPIFTVLRARPQDIFDASEQVTGQCHFIRAVHLRFDDIDRASARITIRSAPLQIVHRSERRYQAVKKTFWNLRALAVQHRVGAHMVANIAD